MPTNLSPPVRKISTARLPAIKAANLLLISTLESDPIMQAQLPQRTGKLYFMWDFAQRTNAMLSSILEDTAPPDTPATRGVVPNVKPSAMTDAQRMELVEDAVGRCWMLDTLVSDTSGETGCMFGEAPGRGAVVSEEIRSASERVLKATSGKWIPEAGGIGAATAPTS